MKILITALPLLLANSALAAKICVDSVADPQAASGTGVASTDCANDCTSGNSGACTLREAVSASNSGDEIDFAISGGGVQTISLAALLTVGTGVFINGYSQPNALAATTTTPATILVALAGTGTDGVVVTAQNTEINGLVWQQFATALEVQANHVTLEGNYFGTDATGTISNAATQNATCILHTNGTFFDIGMGTAATRNVISGCTAYGLHTNALGATVDDNIIGIASDGVSPMSDGTKNVPGNATGIFADTAAAGIVTKNVIAGNSANDILDESLATFMTSNIVGLGADLVSNSALDFGAVGINVNGAAESYIGGSAGEANYISNHRSQDGVALNPAGSGAFSYNFVGLGYAHAGDTVFSAAPNSIGIELLGYEPAAGGSYSITNNVIAGNVTPLDVIFCTNVQISQNLFGVDSAGTIIGNQQPVILAVNTAVTFGGATRTDGNIIVASGDNGLLLGTDGLIENNLIGVTADGTVAGNALDGIQIQSSNGNLTLSNNVISGNGTNGIEIFAGSASIENNIIGLSANATEAVGNGASGILIDGGVGGFTIGGSSAGNFIGGNAGDGIQLNGGVVVQGNTIGLAADLTTPMPNGGNGINILTSGAQIGGAAADLGNIVADNTGEGIVSTNATTPILNTLIYGNAFDLDLSGTDAQVVNDTPDTDGLLNYPILATANDLGTGVNVTGTLNTVAASEILVQFFDEPDVRGIRLRRRATAHRDRHRDNRRQRRRDDFRHRHDGGCRRFSDHRHRDFDLGWHDCRAELRIRRLHHAAQDRHFRLGEHGGQRAGDGQLGDAHGGTQ